MSRSGLEFDWDEYQAAVEADAASANADNEPAAPKTPGEPGAARPLDPDQSGGQR